jgi:predicted DNA-binding transcriptional regulator YafY
MFLSGGFQMKECLLKAIRYGQVLDVMYISKHGEVTKRRIKLLKISGESFKAYCFLRNTKRTFLIGNVLALIPVERKDNLVI